MNKSPALPKLDYSMWDICRSEVIRIDPLAIKTATPHEDWRERLARYKVTHDKVAAAYGEEPIDTMFEPAPYDPALHDHPIFGNEPVIRKVPKRRAPTVKKGIKSTVKKTVKTIKQLISSTPSFLMGVEFEGGVRSAVRDEFEAHMCDLAHTEVDQPIIQFGKDNSVKNLPRGFQPVEIRTQVLPIDDAIYVFEQMLSFLYIASQTKDFVTNQTCGLHINISEPSLFNGRQISFYCNVLSLFDENNILELFDRYDNKFCMPFLEADEDRSVKEIADLYKTIRRKENANKAEYGELWVNGIDEAKLTKYFSVALRDAPVHKNYHGPKVKAHRIEFRCIGNTDYHLRFDDLDSTVNHIIETINDAYYEVIK